MAKEDLKLRVTNNAPLTTKGSALTWAELDANWINIYNAFVSLSQSSYIDVYSASVTYDDTINNYVMYNGQIWKCIAASPIIAITPTEGANWTKKYATDMAGRTQSNEIKRTITADEINSGFSSEIEIISARGAGTFIQVTSGAIKFNAGAIPFDATTFYLKTTSGTIKLSTVTGINGAVDFFKMANTTGGDIAENEAIVVSFNADGSSSPLGDGTIDIYLVYRVVTI